MHTFTRASSSSLQSSLAASGHTTQSYMGQFDGGLVEVAHILGTVATVYSPSRSNFEITVEE